MVLLLMNMSRRMGKNGKLGKKSQLALAAKKCRPIGNYFVRKISATSVKYPLDVFVDDDDRKPPPERHTDLLPTQSEDDRDEACKMTATRSVSTASTAFAAANATTTEESSEDDDDVDLINYTLHIPSRY